ncbi:MAG: bifunctional precorrin-2 dehydrogenase/sirohydrochlorin ferrochelatase [Chloroflexi bacterium]|nr:MAG: bifunctional precorrin-2 dehydrogenase/sirohydrochlorin ferrochelatase [Chloroflexota bacterium]
MIYPISLNLKDKPCLIVGGGNVAKRKAQGLLAAGARVIVISPNIQADFPTVVHIIDTYHPHYLDEIHPILVFATTNDSNVNQTVVTDAQARHILVNNADAPADFTNMTVWQNPPLSVAISTGGASPLLGQHMRRRVADLFTNGYAEFAQYLLDLRGEVIRSIPTQSARYTFWQSVLTPETFALLDNEQHHAAIAKLKEVTLL